MVRDVVDVVTTRSNGVTAARKRSLASTTRHDGRRIQSSSWHHRHPTTTTVFECECCIKFRTFTIEIHTPRHRTKLRIMEIEGVSTAVVVETTATADVNGADPDTYNGAALNARELEWA